MSSQASPPPVRRVALVDDHEIVSVALDTAIGSIAGLVYLGRAETVDELLARFPDVDLAVLDLRLPDGSSPVTNVDRLASRGIAVIVFTSGEDPALVRAAARTAALGVVRKSAPLATLVEALTRVADGEPFMSTDLAAAIDADPGIARVALGPQEQRVLALFAQGSKAQVVASELGIAVATVNDYVRRIRSKYRLAGRPAETKVDLYVRAVEDGILPRARFLMPDREPAASERMLRVVVAALGFGSLVLLVLNLFDAAAQRPALADAWTAGVVAGIAVPSAGMCFAPLSSIRLLRVWCGILAAVVVLGLAALVVAYDADRNPTPGAPWIFHLAVLGAVAAAAAVRPGAAWIYLAALGGLMFATVLAPGGPTTSTPFLDAVSNTLLAVMCFLVALATQRSGRLLDAATATAVTESRAAATTRARSLEDARHHALVHDHVLSTLLAFSRATARDLPATARQARDAIAELRSRPSAGERGELTETALVWMLQATATGLDARLPFQAPARQHGHVVPAAVAEGLRDATTEALRNSLVHADPDDPDRVQRLVRVESRGDRIAVFVLDDGRGFDPAHVPESRLGIRSSIRARMAAVPGGSARVLARPGSGTIVHLEWSPR